MSRSQPQHSMNCNRSHDSSSCRQPNKLFCHKRRRKSVQFSPSVSTRLFFCSGLSPRTPLQTPPQEHQQKRIPSKIKAQAKTLSKLHHQLRSTKNHDQATTSTNVSYASATIVNPTRYEIKGESLRRRGMECLTDIAHGRKHRRIQEEAIRAVEIEQQEQLIQHVLDSYSSSGGSSAVTDQVKSQAIKMDTSKLAKVYSAKTQEALKYAKSVAKEDAKVATAILAEDLQQDSAATASARTAIKKKKSIKPGTHGTMIKSRAKTLANLHHHVRAKKGKSKKTVTISDDTRYEIKGESLRCMERLTGMANGHKRRRVQEYAIRAVEIEQQEQLIQHVLDCYSSSSGSRAAVDQVKSQAIKMDTSKLAKVYSAKTQEALKYAKSVAEEDAKIAAEILAEDLNNALPSRECCPIIYGAAFFLCGIKNSADPRVAVHIVKTSLLPHTMIQQRNLVSAQA